MKIKFPYIICLVLILTSSNLSCKRNSPELLAKEYCDCMKDNGSPKIFIKAVLTCDSIFIKKNRTFKIYKIDIPDYDLDEKLSDITRDSVFKFMKVFNDYTLAHCCDAVARCSEDSIDKADANKIQH